MCEKCDGLGYFKYVGNSLTKITSCHWFDRYSRKCRECDYHMDP